MIGPWIQNEMSPMSLSSESESCRSRSSCWLLLMALNCCTTESAMSSSSESESCRSSSRSLLLLIGLSCRNSTSGDSRSRAFPDIHNMGIHNMDEGSSLTVLLSIRTLFRFFWSNTFRLGLFTAIVRVELLERFIFVEMTLFRTKFVLIEFGITPVTYAMRWNSSDGIISSFSGWFFKKSIRSCAVTSFDLHFP